MIFGYTDIVKLCIKNSLPLKIIRNRVVIIVASLLLPVINAPFTFDNILCKIILSSVLAFNIGVEHLYFLENENKKSAVKRKLKDFLTTSMNTTPTCASYIDANTTTEDLITSSTSSIKNLFKESDLIKRKKYNDYEDYENDYSSGGGGGCEDDDDDDCVCKKPAGNPFDNEDEIKFNDNKSTNEIPKLFIEEAGDHNNTINVDTSDGKIKSNYKNYYIEMKEFVKTNNVIDTNNEFVDKLIGIDTVDDHK